MHTIFLNSSDISSFIGQNKWDSEKSFERLWKRYGTSYNDAVKKLQEEREVLNKEHQELSSKVDNAINNIKYNVDITLPGHSLKSINDIISMSTNTPSEFTKYKEDIFKQIDKDTAKDINSVISVAKKATNLDTNMKSIEKCVDKSTTSVSDRIKRVVNTSDYTSLISASKQSVAGGNEVCKNIEKHIKNSGLSNVEIDEMTTYVKNTVKTTYGTSKENNVIKKYSEMFKVNIDTSQTGFSKDVPIDGMKNNYRFFGKMDGIYRNNCPENDYIIEVKNRTFKLFYYSQNPKIRDYELTQIHVYMFLTGIHTVKLVEALMDNVNIITVTFDTKYFNSIIKKLKKFITFFEDFTSNIIETTNYLKMSDINRRLYLKKKLVFE